MSDRRCVAADTVGYVLKGFPRHSETFISSEIYRLERAGIRLRLYVLKPPDDAVQHPVVDRIASPRYYAPRTRSLSRSWAPGWVAGHLPAFFPALARTFVRWPLGWVRAAGAALAQAIRAREPGTWWPRKVYLKEFLLAAAVADRLRSDADVTHLHAHFCHGATTVTWLVSRMTGLPFSFTAHAKDIYLPGLNPAGLLARKLRAARFAVTCTEANRRHLVATQPGATIYRVYHGLSVDFEELLARDAIRHDFISRPFRILAIGRRVPKKGFDLLLHAVANLRSRGVACILRLIGDDGEAGGDIRNLIGNLGLERVVELMDPMSQAELFHHYRWASAFCLPCRIVADGDRDGVPNVLAEAMAAGLPVVSTRISGIPEMVDAERNGLLVHPDRAEAIAEALERLASDPAFAARLGKAARETVRTRFNGEIAASVLAALFTDPLMHRVRHA